MLFALATQQLLMAYDSTAMNVALSDIVKDLGTTLTGVQSAISLYALVMAALMISGSKLGSRHGYVRVFMVGAAIYGTGALVTALSPNLPVMLLGWSLLEGMGAALVFPAILSIATARFDAATRTKALALIGAMAGVGAALGPIVGGVITRFLTWRVSFLMETVVTLLVVLLMRRVVEQRGPRPGRAFDVLGAVLSALGFGLVVSATLAAGRYGVFAARDDVILFGRTVIVKGGVAPTVWLGVAGLCTLVAFGWWEHRRVVRGQEPLVRIDVLRDRTTRVGSWCLAVQFLVTAGVLFLVPVFVQTTLDYDALRSGLTLLPATATLIVAAAAFSALVGARRATHKSIIVVGFLAIAGGAVQVALMLEPGISGLDLAPGLVLAGLGLGACAMLPDLVQSSARPDNVSDVAGLSRSVSYLGQSVGVALGGVVLLGVLLSSFAAGVRDSQVLTGQQKSVVTRTVESGLQAAAVSDAQAVAVLADKGIIGPAADELVRINAAARVDGLRAAVLVMGVFALMGMALAVRLPRRPRLHSVPDL
ncbi:MFS transporter [Kibdelosporangium aridum]|uniref:MFS transporter n=1 Tax=Kibdelosporangium aridum TaxID=2030 RepID=A0A428Z737_KIBAR|nr:MFS transporter [Kibdelosporangium aridum]RSM83199.1 MFS transporter [Kibdelosporangium aridum]